MKHERGMKELLGQNGTSGGNQDSRQAFTQAGLSMGITPRKEVEGNRLKRKREEGKEFCQYLLRIFMHFVVIYPVLLHSDTD